MCSDSKARAQLGVRLGAGIQATLGHAQGVPGRKGTDIPKRKRRNSVLRGGEMACNDSEIQSLDEEQTLNHWHEDYKPSDYLDQVFLLRSFAFLKPEPTTSCFLQQPQPYNTSCAAFIRGSESKITLAEPRSKHFRVPLIQVAGGRSRESFHLS